MSWMKHTGARYHTQDTGYYCGAACAMVILSEIGVPYADLDQDDLYQSNHDHNVKSGWYTDAYGLRYTLVDRRPSSFTNTFVVHKPTSEAEGTRDIVYTLHTYGVSPAALVFGCAHWITVPGVRTNVEPVGGSSYAVEGFWIHNSVARDNEPHSATDVCGSGGVNGSGNEYVTYSDWQSTYFTGCNYDDPSGNDQFISVCDPDVRDLGLPERLRLERRAHGRELLSPEEAIRHIGLGFEAHRLADDERVGPALQRAGALKPQLVLRLDRRNSSYYLVPWGTRRGARVLARVDARFGDFSGLRVLDRPIENEMLGREAVMDLVAGRRIRLPNELGSLKVYPEAVCVSPYLVWRPCWESWSPNLPFYQVTVGSDTFYVRVDGEVFTGLTTTGKGA
jgi:hypothetical protein